METNGVEVDHVRAVDEDLPPGVYPAMREHGAGSDGWPALYERVQAAEDAGGIPAHGNQRSSWDAGCRFDFDNPEHR